MKIEPRKRTGFAFIGAFTLAEIMVASAVLGIMLLAFCGGLSGGFLVVRLNMENLRATQILQEKMELIRLYNWNQINTPGYVPPSFTAPFFSSGGTNLGLTYAGTVVITNAPIPE